MTIPAVDAPIMIFLLGDTAPVIATVLGAEHRNGNEVWVRARAGSDEVYVNPISICDLTEVLKSRPLICLHLAMGHA